ncbi:MAG: phosphatase PAP2 family protein [Ectothiorhodospiraceae bacterium]|nr:phosphatase PAP2 family protein [Ectothiorhodospiraceae bacterium]
MGSTPLARIPALERAGLLWLNRGARYRPVCQFMRLISRLGNGVVWYSIIAALPVIHGLQDGSRLALQMLATGLICLIVYKMLKRATSRPRPYEVMPDITPSAMVLDRYSFPSGHTLHAVGFSIVLIGHHGDWAWFAVPFTLLVALSRPILGLHYPGDVLAGAALGAAVALALPAIY